uniref:Uncharacterized protein n=1 Tax=Oxyrrhis marina TaxID=2969 RepID=A0A7S4GMN0_OXYMA
MCKHHDPPLEDADFVKQCETFCSVGGKQVGLPLVMGTTTFGFDYTEMRQLCVGGGSEDDVPRYNETAVDYCEDRSDALSQIERRVAQFVSAVKVFKEEQRALRAKMQYQVGQLQIVLRSDEFQEQMDKEVDKIEVLRDTFREFRQEATGTGQAEFKSAMDEVKSSGDLLKKVMDESLQLFSEFLDNCNTMFLSVGSQNEFLLDICAQANEACVDAEGAAHVGCCCAVNPVTAGTAKIDGISELLELDASVDRRLQATSTDVCAEARELAKDAVADAQQRVRDFGSESLLQEQEAAMRDAYPEYSEKCGGGRRLEDLAGSRFREPVDDRPEPPPAADSRRAAVCEPTVDKATGLKVAITARSEDAMCKHGTPLTDDDMVEQCAKFCEPDGVQLLMGSATYGFSLDDAGSVCLPGPDQVLDHNATHIAECEKNSQAFSRVEVRAALLIARLEEFAAARLFYTAEVSVAVQELQDFVRSDEFNVKMDKAVDKMALFRSEIRKRIVEGLAASAGKQRLLSSMEALKAPSEALKLSLEVVVCSRRIPAIRLFWMSARKLGQQRGRR